MEKFLSKKPLKSLLVIFTGLALMLTLRICFADTPAATGLGGMAANITGSFKQFGQLMIAVSYVAGIGFCIMAIFKFKKHRDNPTSVPMGAPIALLGIGIVLIFFPAIITPAGTTLLGAKAATNSGGFSGSGGTLPGGTPGGLRKYNRRLWRL